MRESPPYHPPPPDLLKILHVDGALIVIDKPAGLLSVPGRGPEKADCAVSYTEAQLGEVLVVHRLDMDTSGLMVLARTKTAQSHLSKQFQQRHVEKSYEALVAGEIEETRGTIDAAIARFSHQRPLRHLDPNGLPATTHWEKLSHSPNSSRLRLIPVTGRSHQLRLHMASIGHPILGDAFYGDPSSRERLCLHASSLALQHPVSGLKLSFESPCPF